LADSAPKPTDSRPDGAAEGAARDTAAGAAGRRRFGLLLAAILVVAAGLRIPDLVAGWPYLNYVDEGNVLSVVPSMLRGDGSWRSDFKYPTLYRALAAGAAWLSLRIAPPPAPPDGRAPIASPVESFYANYDPPQILLAGRLVTLFASLALVALPALYWRRLDSPESGLAVAWLAAWCPALLLRSGNATVDALTACFALLSLLLGEVAARRGVQGSWTALAAGVAAGCAFTTKYPGGGILLAVMARIGWGAAPARTRRRQLALALVGTALAAGLTMPQLWLRSGDVSHWLGRLSLSYHRIPSESLWSQAVRRAEWDLAYPGPELGIGLVLLIVLGAGLALAEPRLRRPALAWTVCVAYFVLLFARFRLQPFRNLLPAVPVALLFTGALYSRWSATGWARVGRRIAALALPLVLFAPSLVPYLVARSRLVDSRTQTVRWLAGSTRPGERIWVAAECGILASRLDRLAADVEIAPLAQAPQRQAVKRYRFVLVPKLNGKDPVLAGAIEPLARRARSVVEFGKPTPAATPWLFRSNRPGVRILETSKRRPPRSRHRRSGTARTASAASS